MKKLFIILILVGTYNLAKAQYSFEAKKMTKEYENVEIVENIDSKISIDSDTTEIQIKFKSACLKESIGTLYHRHINNEYQMDIYQQENGDHVIFHYQKKILFMVVFQSKTNNLIFE
jgi:hypothetical protein